MRSGKNSQPARGSLRNLVTNGGSWTVAPVCVTTLCVDTVDIAIPSFENNDQVSRLLILMVDWVTQEGRSDEWVPSLNGAPRWPLTIAQRGTPLKLFCDQPQPITGGAAYLPLTAFCPASTTGDQRSFCASMASWPRCWSLSACF